MSSIRRAVAATTAALTFSTTSWAASGTWNRPAGGNWSDAGSWLGGVPNASGNVATFDPGKPTAGATVNLNAIITVGSILHNNPTSVVISGSNKLVFDNTAAGGNGQVSVNSGAASQMTLSAPVEWLTGTNLNVAANSFLNLSGTFSGSGSLTKNGPGLAIIGPFSAVNNSSWAGTLSINSGVLRIGTSSGNVLALGTAAGSTTIGSGATLDLQGIASANNSITNSSVFRETMNLSGTLFYKRDNLATLAGTTTITGQGLFNVDGPGLLHIGDPFGFVAGGGIAGTGTLVKTGGTADGKVQLNVAAAHTGGSAVDLGTLSIGTRGSLVGTGNVTVGGGGRLEVLEPAGASSTLNSVSPNSVVMNGGSLSLGVNADPATFFNSSSSGGTLLLAANNSNNLNVSTVFGGSDDGNKFRLGGIGGQRNYSGTLSFNAGAVNRDVRVAAVANGPGAGPDALLNVNADRLTISSNLLASNNVNGVRVESGILELTGNNTYTGQTIIDNGELWLVNSTGLGTGSGGDADATIVNPAGILRFTEAPATSGTEKLILNGGSVFAIGGEINGPVEVNAPSRIVGGDLHGNISGAGDLNLISSWFGMELHGANTYTGRTIVGALTDKSVEVRHPTALGGTTQGTIVADRGTLSLFAPVSEPITVDAGGLLLINASSYDGPLKLRGGQMGVGTPSTVTQNITLAGGRSRIGAPSSFNGLLTLNGGITGNGDVEFVRDTLVNGPLSHTGDVIVSFGTTTLNGASSFNGDLILDSAFPTLPGTFLANQDLTASLRLKHGTLRTAAGKTITSVDPNLELQGAVVNANLLGLQTITKIGADQAGLENIGAANAAEINVLEGTLSAAGNSALGSTAGKTSVISTRNAAVELVGGFTYADEIRLNNGSGYSYSGALLVNVPAFVNPATMSGTLNLGASGAYVGGLGTLNMTGPVTGGDLKVVGNGVKFRLNGSGSTYSGATMIAPNGSGNPIFSIGTNGYLSSTSRVEVYKGGVFEIDAEGAPGINDRIADNVPIHLKGGALRLHGDPTPGSVARETVGPITLSTGASEIELAIPNTATDLTLTSLTRQPGATVEFVGLPSPVGAPGFGNVFFTPAPALTNGMFGGWATANREGGRIDFATYDNVKGVIALTDAGRPSQVQGAAGNSNVRTSAALATLTADTTINSLSIDTGAMFVTPVDLNLGGHTLNIVSGGLLRNGSNQDHTTLISNGNITAGGSTANSELIVNISQAAATIGANIVDNPGGAVGLTLTGGSSLELTGTNTYSGQTIVAEGTLRIMTPASLPANADVTVNAGSLHNSSGSSLDLGDATLNGGLSGSSGAPVNADSYDLRSGSVSFIAGNGPLTKTTPGRATIAGDNSAYSGSINVQEGTLAFSNRKSLGTATAVVHPDGVLGNSGEETNFEGKITLNGGKLTLSGGTPARPVSFLGTVNIPVSSSIETGSTASTNLLTVAPGATLNKQGVGTLRLNGFTSVGNNSEFFVNLGTIEVLQTFVTNSQTDTLKLTGPQATSLSSAPSVILNASGFDGGFDLHNIDVYARRTDSVANGKTTVNDGSRLILEVNNTRGDVVLNGGGQMVVPDGFTFIGKVKNSGKLNPGSAPGKPGVLAISGTYAQDAAGKLEVELASPSLKDIVYTQLNDAVRATGAVTLGGELDITLLHDYLPEPGDRFEILRYGSRVGTFSTINGHLLGGDLFFDLVYDSDSLTLEAIEAGPGDSDGDGDVDLSDLGALASGFGITSAASWRSGDFDHDGDVDLGDLGTLASNYDSGRMQAYADFESLVAVPEPGAGAIAGLLGAAVMPRRRRRSCQR